MEKTNLFGACHCEACPPKPWRRRAKPKQSLYMVEIATQKALAMTENVGLPRQKTARNDNLSRVKGFTMIELLVAMFILVIAFGLVTYLYTRAARIKRTVVVNNEVQQVLSQMTDILTYGERNSWGLKNAAQLTDCADEDTKIVVENAGGTEQMTAEIITEEDGIITLVITRDTIPSGTPLTTLIDINQKIQLYAGSKFECFDHTGQWLEPEDPGADLTKTTLVKITLWARSTDPSFKNAPLVPFVTAVRLHNKNPL